MPQAVVPIFQISHINDDVNLKFEHALYLLTWTGIHCEQYSKNDGYLFYRRYDYYQHIMMC